MLDVLLRFMLLWVVVWPLLTLLHELGHATAALAFTQRGVHVELGTMGTARSFSIGRLTIALRLATGFVGFYWFEDRPSRAWHQIIICLAGPLTSLLCIIIAIALIFAPTTPPNWIGLLLVLTASSSAVQFIMTIIPIRYPGWMFGYAGRESDGMCILRSLRHKRMPY